MGRFWLVSKVKVIDSIRAVASFLTKNPIPFRSSFSEFEYHNPSLCCGNLSRKNRVGTRS